MAFLEVVGVRPEVPGQVSVAAFKFPAYVFVSLFTVLDSLVIVFT